MAVAKFILEAILTLALAMMFVVCQPVAMIILIIVLFGKVLSKKGD